MSADRLAVEGEFDVHDYRDRLKLRRQDAHAMTLSNPEGLRCPACDRPFDVLFVSDRESESFDAPPDASFCVVRATDALLVLAH